MVNSYKITGRILLTVNILFQYHLFSIGGLGGLWGEIIYPCFSMMDSLNTIHLFKFSTFNDKINKSSLELKWWSKPK